MAYVIRSHDGRITVCTSDPEMAAERLVELQLQGHGVEASDLNGTKHGVTSLLTAADALAAVMREMKLAA